MSRRGGEPGVSGPDPQAQWERFWRTVKQHAVPLLLFVLAVAAFLKVGSGAVPGIDLSWVHSLGLSVVGNLIGVWWVWDGLGRPY